VIAVIVKMVVGADIAGHAMLVIFAITMNKTVDNALNLV
jgi:hypothetical protein